MTTGWAVRLTYPEHTNSLPYLLNLDRPMSLDTGTRIGGSFSEAMYCRLGPQQQFTASIGCQDPFTTFYASFSGAPVLVSTMIFLQ